MEKQPLALRNIAQAHFLTYLCRDRYGEAQLGYFRGAKGNIEHHQRTSTASPKGTPSINLALSPTISNSNRPRELMTAISVAAGWSCFASNRQFVSCSSQITVKRSSRGACCNC